MRTKRLDPTAEHKNGQPVELTRISCDIPTELHRRVKIRLAQEGKSLRQMVQQALEEYAKTVATL